MRILLALLVLPILLLSCILVAYQAPLPALLGGSRDLVAAIAAGLAGAGYLLALAFYLLWLVRRSARLLDPGLETMGLAGRGYAGVGRRYTGVIDGRSVEVRYLPAYALSAARLDLVVEAQMGTRMAVSRQRPLLDCGDCPSVDLGEGVPYQVYAQDAQIARRMLADPAIVDAFERLMGAPGGAALSVQPDRVWFRARPTSSAGAEIEGWLGVLVSLAAVGEKPGFGTRNLASAQSSNTSASS